jgi:hypothetical protein
MNRRVVIAMAAAAMMFSTSAAFAGGANSQYLRIKNIGATTVRVVAANGPITSEKDLQSKSRLLSQNGVTQFVLKKAPGVFLVANPAFTDGDGLEYSFPKSTYVYLQAKEVGGKFTPSFAPPGTRF